MAIGQKIKSSRLIGMPPNRSYRKLINLWERLQPRVLIDRL